MNPEIILWSRVLLQAIWDVAGIKLKLPKSEVPRLQRTTRAWFLSVTDSPGSFIWVCHILSLDPNAVRRRVLTKPRAELVSLASNPAPEWGADSIPALASQEVEGISSESRLAIL
jgi:hypothetical protein